MAQEVIPGMENRNSQNYTLLFICSVVIGNLSAPSFLINFKKCFTSHHYAALPNSLAFHLHLCNAEVLLAERNFKCRLFQEATSIKSFIDNVITSSVYHLHLHTQSVYSVVLFIKKCCSKIPIKMFKDRHCSRLHLNGV